MPCSTPIVCGVQYKHVAKPVCRKIVHALCNNSATRTCLVCVRIGSRQSWRTAMKWTFTCAYHRHSWLYHSMPSVCPDPLRVFAHPDLVPFYMYYSQRQFFIYKAFTGRVVRHSFSTILRLCIFLFKFKFV